MKTIDLTNALFRAQDAVKYLDVLVRYLPEVESTLRAALEDKLDAGAAKYVSDTLTRARQLLHGES